jgi:hypothetical protein
MTHAAPRSPRLRRTRQKREGAALLIVLLVLMMATGTAVYTVNSTQFEVRAAGSLHQAMRTRYVSEAATVSVLGLCYQMTVAGCVDIKRASSNLTSDVREKYALPDWGNTEVVYSLTGDDLKYNFVGTVLARDSDLTGGGTAAPYSASFDTVLEKWEVPNPGDARPRFRLIVSTYASYGFDPNADGKFDDDIIGTGEWRSAHQTISATRAFFDIR